MRTEIDILKTLRHPNIITLLNWFETAGEICVVLEYALGDLFTILLDDHHIAEEEVRKIACQLVDALQ